MKIKVSNYLSERLVQAGITDVFTVTGGGAMHLNDALGHQKGLTCWYNHHEQASAIAAEAHPQPARPRLCDHRPWRDQRADGSGWGIP